MSTKEDFSMRTVTVNDTATMLGLRTVDPDQAVLFLAKIIAKGNGHMTVFDVVTEVLRVGTTAAKIVTGQVSATPSTGWKLDVSLSGNNLQMKITGDKNNQVTWLVQGTYMVN